MLLGPPSFLLTLLAAFLPGVLTCLPILLLYALAPRRFCSSFCLPETALLGVYTLPSTTSLMWRNRAVYAMRQRLIPLVTCWCWWQWRRDGIRWRTA